MAPTVIYTSSRFRSSDKSTHLIHMSCLRTGLCTGQGSMYFLIRSAHFSLRVLLPRSQLHCTYTDFSECARLSQHLVSEPFDREHCLIRADIVWSHLTKMLTSMAEEIREKLWLTLL